ncbi:MAG: caspase family protein [Bacteroidetes bacterium]|nr:caspase family protein [Bacteroidota bacterium]
MKKLIILISVVMVSVTLAQTNRSISKSFTLRPKKELTKTIPVINMERMNLPSSGVLSSKEESITISGKIEDENKIRAVFLNNKRINFADDGNFETSVVLSEGENTFTIDVENVTDGKAQTEFTVLFSPDYLPPQVEFPGLYLTGSNTLNFSGDSYTLRGRITDEYGLKSFVVNDASVDVQENGNFSIVLSLVKGENKVSVKAVNHKDKTFEKEFIIVSEEIFPPIVSFPTLKLSPNKELVVIADRIEIVGQITDSYGIKSLYINGQSVEVAQDGKFRETIQLNEGSNKITVNAKNIKDKSTIEVLTIVSSITAPAFDLSSLNLSETNELVFNNDQITINGKVEDAFGISKLTVNGMEVELNNVGQFSSVVNLKDGRNSITVTAINAKNKSTSKTFTIISNQLIIPPQITITDPVLTNSMELTSDDKYVRVKGLASDELGIKEIVVSLNDIVVQRTTRGEFEAYVSPGEGVNRVTVRAINIKNTSSVVAFTIIQPVDKTGPELTIYEPKTTRGIQVVHKSEILSVRGKAIDESGVFKVTVNNVTSNLLPNGEFQTDIQLKMGENRLVLQAFDNKYNLTSDTLYVIRELEDIVVGKYYALIIGINKYEGFWRPLGNAVNDASEVAKVLQENYKIDKIYTLFDEDATEDGITQMLYNISDEMSAEDNLFIYYAGHGYLDPITNRGYWVPAGSKINLISRYISNSDLRDIIAGLKSKHILLVTDACFAGDIFRGLTTTSIKKDPNDMNKYYRQVYSKTSRIAMTSGGVEPVQDAGKDGHSIFTYYLIKSLKENNNKYMDVEQLYNEFKVAVTNNSNQSPRLDRIKNTNDEGGQFIFIKK